MNWGTKILIVYVAFIAGILMMVFKSSSQKTDLVTTDYYAKELKYQDKIDEMNRVAALSEPVGYTVKDNSLLIKFPKLLQILIPPASKGLYELHLSWQDGEVTYYFEKKINI